MRFRFERILPISQRKRSCNVIRICLINLMSSSLYNFYCLIFLADPCSLHFTCNLWVMMSVIDFSHKPWDFLQCFSLSPLVISSAFELSFGELLDYISWSLLWLCGTKESLVSSCEVSSVMAWFIPWKNSFKSSLRSSNVSVNNGHLSNVGDHLLCWPLSGSVLVRMLELGLVHCVQLSESVVRNNVICVPLIHTRKSTKWL